MWYVNELEEKFLSKITHGIQWYKFRVDLNDILGIKAQNLKIIAQ